jgi:hypothetical protein
MSKPLLRLTLALVLPVAGTLGFTPAADANVRTVTLGNTCQFVHSAVRAGLVDAEPGPGKVGAFYGFDDDGIHLDSDHQNPNAQFGIICPVARHLPLSTDGLSDLEVRFRATGGSSWSNTSPPREVRCFATSYRKDGSILDSAEMTIGVPRPTYPNTPTVVMDFNDAINVSDSKGTYGITCLIPVGVSLHSIYHSEVDGVAGN